MSGEGIRARRVSESIRAHLAEALAREVSDPRLSGVVITSVGLPDDLSVAWVSVRTLGGEDDEKTQRRLLAALERAAGRLRRGLGPAIRLKRVPELRFVYDAGQEASRRVESLLKEIEAERAERDRQK